MSWRDRDYNQSHSGGPQDGLGRMIGWLSYGRVHLYTAWGIRVAVHPTFIIFAALSLLLNYQQGYDFQDKVATMTLLFGLVLLHEYGHCFAARWVGGSADDILMWPLGGLAFTAPPPRPLPSFITTAAGPAVNIVVCVLCLSVLAFTLDDVAALGWGDLFNPFAFLIPYEIALSYSDLSFWVWYCFKISWLLFVFNAFLPVFPLDGGRMIQAILWARIGYYRSMIFATLTGQIGCAAMAAAGLFFRDLTLILLGVLFFFHNRQMHQQVKAQGPHGLEEDEPDWKRSLRDDPDTKPGFAQRLRIKRNTRHAERQAAATAKLEAEVDEVLAKISRSGMHSLTNAEKRVLERARHLK